MKDRPIVPSSHRIMLKIVRFLLLAIVTSEPDVCDMCLGQGQSQDCGRDYISTEEFEKLENLITEQNKNMTQDIQSSMAILNQGTILTIDNKLKESNQKIIKQIVKNHLQTNEWFGKLGETMKNLYTDHAFLKINQKEMFAKLETVSDQITALKKHLIKKDSDKELRGK